MNGNFCMKTASVHFLILLTFFVREIFSSEVPRPRGVSLSRASLYPPDTDFICFDGSKTIPFIRINDDYCDCLDASDEPGTSACPNGLFHCTNAGHRPLNIPSNRVNDGICDCCDGTDEYATETSCQNNCIELGRSAREAAQKKADLIKAGKQIRAEMGQKGVQLKQEKQMKLADLKKNRDEAEKLKLEKEALKKEIESLEDKALEYYRKLEDEAKIMKKEEESASQRAEAIETFNKFDSNQDGWLEISEVKVSTSFDRDGNGEVSDEEAKFYLNFQESVDLDTFVKTCWKTLRPVIFREGAEKTPEKKDDENLEEEDEMQDDQELEEESEDHDYEDEEQESQEPEQATEAPPTIKYDDETQQLVERATAARNEYEEARKLVNDIDREIKKIEEYLGKDFGTDEEFAALEGQCFDYEDHEYIYKLCLFDKTTQQPKSGGSNVRLGFWGHWSGPEHNKYEQMTFESGQSCWNGPKRTTVVRVTCGSDNQVLSVSEPNRCEYFFEFVTPAACQEAPVVENEDLHDEL
ncbi:glucosidase 2 subunit beta-like [Diorhabda sublineata]|uniref:glucosidase 2 subunit beta-like n=1 Tax=Diorhabda sublineata TaxID=1163346 RepID=UPI0024E07362|nr:glucosidase 2 subunit beta-like [Diorhabda sublineata]